MDTVRAHADAVSSRERCGINCQVAHTVGLNFIARPIDDNTLARNRHGHVRDAVAMAKQEQTTGAFPDAKRLAKKHRYRPDRADRADRAAAARFSRHTLAQPSLVRAANTSLLRRSSGQAQAFESKGVDRDDEA